MSKRLREVFERGRAEGRPLFMPYLTAGYPRRELTPELLLALEAGGADVIELGVPFTDPMADGATVQHANEVAVAQGVSLRECYEMVRQARGQGLEAPVLLMGYSNPFLALGIEAAVAGAAEAGADGFIAVDLPPEEAAEFIEACRVHDMSFVPLVTPTTTNERIELLSEIGDAFLYCVSVTGTTGQRKELPATLPEFLGRVRKHSHLPLAVGFGISTREHVEAVGKLADAAVVGSAIIAAIDAADSDRIVQSVREYVEDVSGQHGRDVDGSR